MSFSSWQDFFHMGGYALYVWLSYGLAVLVLGALVLLPLLRHRQLRRAEQRQARRAHKRKESSPS